MYFCSYADMKEKCLIFMIILRSKIIMIRGFIFIIIIIDIILVIVVIFIILLKKNI